MTGMDIFIPFIINLITAEIGEMNNDLERFSQAINSNQQIKKEIEYITSKALILIPESKEFPEHSLKALLNDLEGQIIIGKMFSDSSREGIQNEDESQIIEEFKKCASKHLIVGKTEFDNVVNELFDLMRSLLRKSYDIALNYTRNPLFAEKKAIERGKQSYKNHKLTHKVLHEIQSQAIGKTPTVYLQELINKFESKKIFNIPSGCTLKQVFVDPLARIYELDKISGYRKEINNNRSESSLLLIEKYLFDNEKRLLFIENTYGMGKSSICCAFASKYAKKHVMGNNSLIPIVFSLRDYNATLSTLQGFVDDSGIGIKLNPDEKYIFIFDAYDELFSKNQNDAKAFKSNYPKWKNNIFKNSYFLITTRQGHDLKMNNYPILVIDKFNSEARNIWVNNWNMHRKSKHFFLLNEVAKHISNDLLEMPIFLYVAAIAHENFKKENDSYRFSCGAELFEHFFSVTKEGFYVKDDEKSDSDLLTLSGEEHQEIAYYFYTENKQYLTLDEFNMLLSEKNPTLVSRIIKSNKVDSFFSQYFFEPVPGGYKFAITSLYDFLVSRRVASRLIDFVLIGDVLPSEKAQLIIKHELGKKLLTNEMIQFLKDLILILTKNKIGLRDKINKMLISWFEDHSILLEINETGNNSLRREKDKSANIRLIALCIIIPLADELGISYCLEKDSLHRFLFFLDTATNNHKSLLKKHLARVNINKAYLRGINLKDTFLSHANLSNADLRISDLSCSTLDNANLCGADLRNVTLNGASLRNAKLCGANLCSADILSVDLFCADLSDSCLRDANLSGATLGGACLSKADLVNADLSYTVLRNVDFSNANLYGVCLSGADLRGTKFIQANIHGVKGLTSDEIIDLKKRGAIEIPQASENIMKMS